MGRAFVGLASTAAAMALAAGPGQAAQPSFTKAEAYALFAAAGFPLGPHKRLLNRCRRPANPKVTFVDMNGDGRVEAFFIDEGPCYKPDGRWYALATQSSDGRWRRILEGEGTLNATGTAFHGWMALTATGDGRTTRLHYNGQVYASADRAPETTDASETGLAPPSEAATAPRSAEPAPKEAAPAGAGYPTDGWKAPVRFAELPRAEQASIMRAAGFKLDGKTWKGCEGSSSVDKDGVEIKDLNGDGRPEAVITDGGFDCYGNSGQGFTVLMPVPGGWKKMASETGIPVFLKRRGAQNFPDIVIEGPGTCYPVERWNGRGYRVVGAQSDLDGKGHGRPCKL